MTTIEPVRLDTRRVYSGHVINVDRDTIRTPTGSTLQLEMVRHPGAAAIVPILDDPTGPDPSVLLIEQYRYAANGRIWEIPAGVLEPGERPEDAAHRELREETGATAGRMEHLTTVFTTPGFTDERIHLFMASDIAAGEAHLAGDEFLRPEARPMSEILGMIRDQRIVDAKSIVALLYVAGYRLGR